MNTRVNGILWVEEDASTIEHQGPEAALEGDLCVRQEARGCVWHADTFRRRERTMVRKS